MTSAWRNDGCSLDLNSPGATSSTTSSISIWPDKECKPRNHDAKPGTRALTWLFGVKHVIGTCTFRELTCPKAGTIGRQHSCAGTMASLLGPCRSTPLRPKLSTAETATPQKPTAHHPIDRPPSNAAAVHSAFSVFFRPHAQHGRRPRIASHLALEMRKRLHCH